jgi:hypothetical protein
MLAAVEMLGGMFVFRGIAAGDVPAFQAHAQVHPDVPHFQALVANMLGRLGEFDSLEMLAYFRHWFLHKAGLAALYA